MQTQVSILKPANRREFLRHAAALAACAAVQPHLLGAETAPPAKPNSVFNGVRIGVITYSYRGAGIDTAEQTLKALLEDGLSEVELMDGPIRSFAGIRGGGRRGAPPEAPAENPTDAEREAQLAKCGELRKMYNDAGVNIHHHKLPFGQSDEEIDFTFSVAKALGCTGIKPER